MRRARYIVVLGPDGCGKSTVADSLARTLSEYVPVRRMNFSFGYMPPLSRIFGCEPRRPPPEGQLNSGMVGPLRRPRALLLAIWYGIDHVLGHLALRRARAGEVVIFARSYHDFLYQRAYINVPRVLARLFLALGPHPDLVAAPVRDAATIHEDKPELTVKEISDQYARIVHRMKGCHYFAVIDASAGVEDTVRQLRKRAGL